MPMMMLPGRDASVSTLLEAASQLFRATLFKTLPEAMIAALCAQAPLLYLTAHGIKTPLTQPPDDPAFWMLYVAGLAASLWLMSTVLLRQRTLLGGGVPDLRAELMFALRRLPVQLAAVVLAGAALSLCAYPLLVPMGALSLLLGIPMLVLAFFLIVCFFIVPCVALFEALGPWQVLRTSVLRIRSMWWKSTAAFVIGLLVVAVCVIMASAVLGVLMGVLGNAASAPMQALQTALALLFEAGMQCFMLALAQVLYSAASSSA
ncbi:MAG: hypothetical protein QM718_14520 [Steroidobacteraceae bacterium]